MHDFLQILRQSIDKNPGQVLLLSLLVYCLCFLVMVQLWLLALGTISGMDLLSAGDALINGASASSMEAQLFRFAQFGNQFLGFGLTAWIMAYLMGGFRQNLGLATPYKPILSLWAVLMMLSSIPLVQFLILSPDNLMQVGFPEEMVLQMVEQESYFEQVLSQLFYQADTGSLLLNLIIFAATPAICEEILFRGYLQSQFQKMMGPHAAVWVSAAIFSIIHFQPIGFLGRLFLGALLGYFFLYAKNLMPSIIAHFVFNAFSVIGTWFNPAIANDEIEIPLWSVFAGVLLTAVFFYIYQKQADSRENKDETTIHLSDT